MTHVQTLDFGTFNFLAIPLLFIPASNIPIARYLRLIGRVRVILTKSHLNWLLPPNLKYRLAVVKFSNFAINHTLPFAQLNNNGKVIELAMYFTMRRRLRGRVNF